MLRERGKKGGGEWSKVRKGMRPSQRKSDLIKKKKPGKHPEKVAKEQLTRAGRGNGERGGQGGWMKTYIGSWTTQKL